MWSTRWRANWTCEPSGHLPALHRTPSFGKAFSFFRPPHSSKKSCPADMCGWTGHIQGNLALRVCEATRPSARFCAKFCPQGDIRGKEFLTRVCGQKWVPPKARRRYSWRTSALSSTVSSSRAVASMSAEARGPTTPSPFRSRPVAASRMDWVSGWSLLNRRTASAV